MVIADAIAMIKLSLGSTIVNVELGDEDISTFLSYAYAKAYDVMGDTELKEVDASIPCQDFVAETVIRVFDNQLTNFSCDYEDIFNSLIIYNGQTSMFRSYKDIIIKRGYASQASQASFKSFYFKSNKLYLNNYKGRVTVEYVPKQVDFDIADFKLQDWSIRYAKVLCKEAIGRIRSKYKPQSSPFETDGDQLLNEYDAEKQSLVDELNQEGLFFVDWD